MEDDVDRVGARDLRDEREKPVPEGEGVAGVQPAVRELVGAPERQVAECEELLDPREMEEAVAAHVPGDVPSQDAEERPCGEHGAAPGGLPVHRHEISVPAPPDADDERRAACRQEEDQRRRERAVDDERHRERGEDEREGPRDRGRCTTDAEVPQERARCEDDGESEDELEQEPEAAHRRFRPLIRRAAPRRGRSQPGGSVAIETPSLAAIQPAARQERRAQQLPRLLGLARATVERQVAQVPTDVLAEHAPAVRGAADVDAPRRGREHDAPARIGGAAHPVDLLAEEEVPLVERPDRVVRAAAQEKARPHHPLHLALALVVEARSVERIEGARAQRSEMRVLGREPPQRRVAADGALERPVAVLQARPDRRLRAGGGRAISVVGFTRSMETGPRRTRKAPAPSDPLY